MALPFDLWVDAELGIMHTRPECPSAKIPSKYGYLRREFVRTVEQARDLDRRFRVCEGCKEEFEKKNGPAAQRKSHYRRRGAQE